MKCGMVFLPHGSHSVRQEGVQITFQYSNWRIQVEVAKAYVNTRQGSTCSNCTIVHRSVIILGLFTVAIFGFIFGSFSHVWQKNDQNDPKNETQNDMKNGYCKHPGKQK